MAAPGSGRGGWGVRRALPIGPPHGALRPSDAALARDVGVARVAGDGDATDPLWPGGLPDDLLPARDPGEAGGGHRRAGRRAPRPRHRRRLERDGAPDVRHPLPAPPGAHGPLRVRGPGDPRALARRAGHARPAPLPTGRGAELPPAGRRGPDRRRSRRATDDARGRRAGGRVERHPRDVRRLSAEARRPGWALPVATPPPSACR
jgi:hypothetical protein